MEYILLNNEEASPDYFPPCWCQLWVPDGCWWGGGSCGQVTVMPMGTD